MCVFFWDYPKKFFILYTHILYTYIHIMYIFTYSFINIYFILIFWHIFISIFWYNLSRSNNFNRELIIRNYIDDKLNLPIVSDGKTSEKTCHKHYDTWYKTHKYNDFTGQFNKISSTFLIRSEMHFFTSSLNVKATKHPSQERYRSSMKVLILKTYILQYKKKSIFLHRTG